MISWSDAAPPGRVAAPPGSGRARPARSQGRLRGAQLRQRGARPARGDHLPKFYADQALVPPGLLALLTGVDAAPGAGSVVLGTVGGLAGCAAAFHLLRIRAALRLRRAPPAPELVAAHLRALASDAPELPAPLGAQTTADDPASHT